MASLKDSKSPLSGTKLTKQTSKQNITRDTEIKNNLTVTRGEVGGDNGEEFPGTTIKDTWTKPREIEAGERGGDGWVGGE